MISWMNDTALISVYFPPHFDNSGTHPIQGVHFLIDWIRMLWALVFIFICVIKYGAHSNHLGMAWWLWSSVWCCGFHHDNYGNNYKNKTNEPPRVYAKHWIIYHINSDIYSFTAAYFPWTLVDECEVQHIAGMKQSRWIDSSKWRYEWTKYSDPLHTSVMTSSEHTVKSESSKVNWEANRVILKVFHYFWNL